jgi:hypothetical protein
MIDQDVTDKVWVRDGNSMAGLPRRIRLSKGVKLSIHQALRILLWYNC